MNFLIRRQAAEAGRAAGIMALFHFRNCFALAYFRCFTTYKCSGLSESSAFWKCVQAGVAYLFVQLCKMLFLVTFFPTWEGGIYDFIGEFMKASVDVADPIGLNLVMSRNAGKGEYKIMVWMITRYDLHHTYRPAVLLLMFLSVYKAFDMETFVHLCSLGSWTALLARVLVTGLLALSSSALYNNRSCLTFISKLDIPKQSIQCNMDKRARTEDHNMALETLHQKSSLLDGLHHDAFMTKDEKVLLSSNED
ncbi:hypothetical protein Celaphus_00003862 [Cervus elaphus hippelaphus]|uniref:BOS complex subunit TMEM147 n=1 Tax=Cervus elaphus hippelaphus TaxID=46360 RepID=A0A212D0D4_CEREH|nr:hypothetical protein Celaphus_00003862 [Cervus elaphus hippelaphus]